MKRNETDRIVWRQFLHTPLKRKKFYQLAHAPIIDKRVETSINNNKIHLIVATSFHAYERQKKVGQVEKSIECSIYFSFCFEISFNQQTTVLSTASGSGGIETIN